MKKQTDKQFEDKIITEVRGESSTGFQITVDDGWSFFVPKDAPIEPKVDMVARFYGKGIGSPVRGLDLDGTEIFYRTPNEDKEHHEIQTYGADAADWLKRWDENKSVWSIEMGGLGPGYEQCIHITCAEMLRYFLAQNFDFDAIEKAGEWETVRDQIDKEIFEIPAVKSLGLSGAQYGAAMSLAGHFYRKGPRGVMTDKAVKDRHIQVSREFPQAVAA